MKLSIFPEAKPLPTQEEKKAESFKVSKPYKPEVCEFNTEDDLIDLITQYTWSPFIFTEYRREDDFISTDLLVFDIDEGMTIEEAENIVKELDVTCLCLPTTSHAEDHHKFRLLFPLSKTIFNPEEYKDTYFKYAKYFTTDPACKDLARFYFGSTTEDGFFWDADLLKPFLDTNKKPSDKRYDTSETVDVGEDLEEIVEYLFGEKRKKIPESISHFLENAPDNLEGQWYSSSNSFLFTCGLMNLDHGKITNVFYRHYPFNVSRRVEKTVDKIIKDGYNSRQED